MKARLVFRQKHVFSDAAIVEMKVWQMPETFRHPEGIKYSLVYIDKFCQRILGYDNAHGKGHHRHDGMGESLFLFISVEDLVKTFLSEVHVLRRSQK